MIKPDGKVVCVDVQDRMLNVLKKKAKKAGLTNLIETVTCDDNSLNMEGYEEKVDFAFAIAVLHEVPDQTRIFFEIKEVLKPGGKLLISEPKGHVNESDFKRSISIAEQNNFKVINQIMIHKSLTALLEKPE
jgi:ubiquinone/menaquinone biosynthesis C-methylase UbiE